MAEGIEQSKDLSKTFVDGTDVYFELFCVPCDMDGRHVEAFGYCQDCSECLCKECRTLHQRAARNHVLFDKTNMPKQLASSRNRAPQDKCTYNCEKHPGKAIEHYCHEHNTLTCSACAFAEHRNCKTVDNIPDVSVDIDKETEFTDMIDRLKNMQSTGSTIQQNSQKGIILSKRNANAVITSVRTYTQEMIFTLQMFEKSLEFETEQIQSNDEKRLQAVTTRSQTSLQEIGDVLRGLTVLKTNRQYCNLFVALKRAKTNAQAMEQDLDTALRDSIVDELIFKPDVDLQDVLRQSGALGHITVACPVPVDSINGSDTANESESGQNTENVIPMGTISLSATLSGAIPEPAVSLPTELAVRDMDRNVKAHHVTDIFVECKKDKKECSITGLAVLQADMLVATDNNNKSVKLIDIQKRRVMHYKKLKSSPWDITPVTDDTVAVTMPDAATIQYLNVSTDGRLGIGRSFSVNGACHGIACAKQHLWVTYLEPGKVEALTMDGQVQLCIRQQNVFTEPNYLALSPDMDTVYVSDVFAHAIISISNRNNVLSVSKHVDCSAPTGIAIAADSGEVFMCEQGGEDDTNAFNSDTIRGVYMLKSRKITKLLNRDQTGGAPWALAYNDVFELIYIGLRGCRNISVYTLDESSCCHH